LRSSRRYALTFTSYSIALMSHCPLSLSIMFWWGRGTKISQGCERLVPLNMLALMLIFALIPYCNNCIRANAAFSTQFS
jgi:hypothetical protein